MPATLTRTLGKNGPEIPAIGFGLMGIGIDCYGATGDDEERFAVLDHAWEQGCTHWDTSDAYGDSEDLIGKWFKLHPERRADIFLATKFGISAEVQPDGTYKMSVNSSPEYAKTACEKSLKRLGVDYIDLYYVHRVDGKTPIEKTVQALVELKNEGKIKHLGFSEISGESLRRACAVHPIAAVQIEYNPWALETEGPVSKYLLKACRELGVATIAYSPLGRGMLTGQYTSTAELEEKDFRKHVEHFKGDNMQKNLQLVNKFKQVAEKKGCSLSQLALAWLLAQGDDIFPIPGTKKIKYLDDNWGAQNVRLTAGEAGEIRRLVDQLGVAGGRDIAFNQYADTPAL
ncbi:aldo-keto reductase str7 [Trichoderma asperellum]|uniref:Aldo-keto reductase str7 n=1 Tax=Trichoderma asperellum TaxID=101201 RepID=A0A6V8QXX4_TRIAP|nr:NADP-dependent oxidoreductase domain-containing protein [Trichoderma asperelloides]GFP57531.1 aldo-keto reductase str7 [Trichoderma asperellum]